MDQRKDIGPHSAGMQNTGGKRNGKRHEAAQEAASYIKPDCVDQAAWRATMKDAWQSIDHTTLDEYLEREECGEEQIEEEWKDQ